MQNNIETLEIEISDIIYQNENNGYTVFEFETPEALETATGIVPGLYVGEHIRISGQWTTHQTYGKQFKVISFEKTTPSDTQSMLRYLASGAIKGIGPKTADRIVEKFGDDTFSVLENSPELLSEIKGISRNRARDIFISFNSQFGMRNVMIFFNEFFGPSLTAKIYKRWGSASVDLVKSNPYLLCNEINGIGFEKADSVAMSLGCPKDSAERIEAGIVYLLKQDAMSMGNMYTLQNTLVESASDLLGVERDRVRECVSSMLARKLLVTYEFDDCDGTALYLPLNYHIERGIADKLTLLSKFDVAKSFTNIEKIISDVEATEGIKYAPSQHNAIVSALQNPVYILTGGPGTGKTTIIRAIIKIYSNMGLKYVLAAPTGRAAKRMSESTSCEAKTIHRLLEFEYSASDDDLNFSKDESNPLDSDVIIIDEVSMVDSNLFYSLLRAISPSSRLLLIGDANQLSSVGPGNVLKDIINSGVFKVGVLNEIFRQDEQSSIVLNAHKINSGIYPDLSNKSSDFFFMSRNTASAVAMTVGELYAKRLPATYGDSIIDDIQVLCPSRKSECGTVMLNKMIQSIKNPPQDSKRQIVVRDFILREGDRVMQTKNNYDICWTKTNILGFEEDGCGVFNGDIGTVTAIDSKTEKITIDFDGRITEYTYQNLEEIEHAYAITVHKSQGSEYPVVIIPLISSSMLLMSRNLLYTAITRASKMVIIIGTKEAVYSMVNNKTDTRRNTGLVKFLREKHEIN